MLKFILAIAKLYKSFSLIFIMVKVMKKVFEIFLDTRWTYLFLGVIFFILTKGDFSFNNNYFVLGIFILIVSVISIGINRIWRKKW
jgi:hypothetical protein